MSQSTRFGAYVDFYYNVVQTGPDATSVINTQVGAINQYQVSMGAANQGSMQMAMSLRRLALDFRLLSTSIRTVTRELGISEGVMAALSSAGVAVASAITGIISAFNIYRRLTTTAAGGTIALTASLKGLAASASAALVILAPYIIALLAIAAALYALNWAFEKVSGIEAYRNQLKGLEDSLKQTEDAMKALRAEQSALNAETAGLSKEEADLEAQFKSGLITEEQYNKAMENLAVQKAINRAESQDLALTEAILTNAAEQNKYQQDQLKQSIEETRAEAFKQLPHQMGSPIMDFFSRLWGGEATPTGAGGGVRGDVNLTVSLAGANIYGTEGIDAALTASSDRMRTELEYMRRSRTSQGIR